MSAADALRSRGHAAKFNSCCSYRRVDSWRGMAQMVKDAIGSEVELAATCATLIGDLSLCSAEELALVTGPRSPSDFFIVQELCSLILVDRDPLGDAFVQLRRPEVRRKLGATYTPAALVERVIAVGAANRRPARIVEPGAGSGRFLLAAARRFPDAELIAIESDPLAALVLRANVAVCQLTSRVVIVVEDYRNTILPKIDGSTLFIGNPPYVRHHDINPRWKEWFARTAQQHGVKQPSKLAGLHLHFFVKTLDLADSGDYGAFITAGEWLDVNYGATLRELLGGRLGGCSIDILDPKSMPFSDAMTTGVITAFHVDRRPAHLELRHAQSVGSLAGTKPTVAIPWRELRDAPRWSIHVRSAPRLSAGQIELGEIFRVHRGQVTGNNRLWIYDDLSTPKLPSSFLRPTVTKARELIECGLAPLTAAKLRRVIDLPAELEAIPSPDRDAIDEFLLWAKRHGADQSYIAQHRAAWWSVKLYAPAPIVCTYMARRAPVFVRNVCGARHLNIALGLYPSEPVSQQLLAALLDYLRSNVSLTSGRTYGGGLTKFEPGEMQRVPVPHPDTLAA